ncbi:hypothetical protein AAWM_00542 [Aspergillus awamori]|uniref:Tim17/Tim22/Tim23/Pmp24 family-domain-containing protein n=6 Tax=Aspergillus TaxID=5052 RepID=A0A3F3QJP2_9EURO|nr:hypothetical protein ANI_1_2008064 [Aspergillus niger CBS 513.88]XP_025455766.1 uncharacterized protein BO96DRAFT_445168 [Aspergillus niger CBS 101883]XP_026632242.1 hypothetical protein BDQ94DRAFT_164971 [Aspergillus welwitschiae]EHA24183.1 hypothetical protein ASPNIDRAFT_39770 [Aspergillus niger ATCC 1015]KAI2814107.1 hypothetical protein CBS115989_8817 [Aspergillus niger]RDH23812.1 hypothetical protein M747DRAFT_338117 [Aspergillus niger ATCC 13496]RDK45207.1 hypothetical protein M752DR|eukprot:XP_001391834.2 hypothetical protein ANI_1_2008064 [Aspergillus niger CBS 513.88]
MAEKGWDRLTGPPNDDSLLWKIWHWDRFFEADAPPRLGIKLRKRVLYMSASAWSAGMMIGYMHGSKTASYRFRAENAHRFPDAARGWYQYHKSKNYHAFLQGSSQGMKMGFRLGAGALCFCLLEEVVDYARHDQRDFLSTVTAGLSMSGIYSVLARQDIYTAARSAKTGLKLSLAYGIVQDVLESWQGTRPAYIDIVLGSRRSKTE